MTSKKQTVASGMCTEWRCIKTNALHHEHEPAREWKDGCKEWYLHGERHRIGAPAILYSNICSEAWYVHGKLHREDGMAMMWSDGISGAYYCNGTSYGADAEAWAKAILEHRHWETGSDAIITDAMVREFLLPILSKQVNECV